MREVVVGASAQHVHRDDEDFFPGRSGLPAA
jgi:hypothetical protein